MKASPLQRHILVNCRHQDVELLPVLTEVCSNNWSSLLLKVCASFMCWRCKASIFSQWFLLKLPPLEEKAFCYTAVPSYGNSFVLDSRHFVPFYKENQLCSAVSHSKGFVQPWQLPYSHSSLSSPLFNCFLKKNHILLSVSTVLTVQVLSPSYFYLLLFCLFTHRSWQFFTTHVHTRSAHWYALIPRTLIAAGVTPFQLTPRPQLPRHDLYSAFTFIH